MTKAKQKLIKNIRSKNFEKFISVAHKDNGEEFFDEVQSLPILNFSCFFLCILFVVIEVNILTLHSLFPQIDRHFSTFLMPDMTIEKLQKVATTHVDASFKARWLRWWNSPTDVKTQNIFPSSVPLREKVLEDWLHKASLWAQVYHPSFFAFLYALQLFLFSDFHVCILLVGERC